jgi:hypothetical protein
MTNTDTQSPAEAEQMRQFMHERGYWPEFVWWLEGASWQGTELRRKGGEQPAGPSLPPANVQPSPADAERESWVEEFEVWWVQQGIVGMCETAMHSYARRAWLESRERLRQREAALLDDIGWLDTAIQNAWAVIGFYDGLSASPTSDQREVLDDLRRALRSSRRARAALGLAEAD